jgi:AcrR family transcriptional regulator
MERTLAAAQSQGKRKSAEDWQEAALDAIAEGGVGSLAIPALATSLGVTKGSFYWHFDSLDALIAAALRLWETLDLQAIEQLDRIADPEKRLRAAFDEAMEARRGQALYVTLAMSSDRGVIRVLRQVSRRRIRFLGRAFAKLGLAGPEALERALLTYTAYLGLIQLRRQSIERLRSARDLEAYVAHVARTLIRP